ncbi:MAG: hypothetical protein AAFR96_06955 [Planctomycetota bacterium]
MRLTDIMSHMDLSIYPQIGLVLFLAAFAAVIWKVLRSEKQESRSMALLPLDDDGAAAQPGTKESGHGA